MKSFYLKCVVVVAMGLVSWERVAPLGFYALRNRAFMNIGKCYGAKVMPIISPATKQGASNSDWILLFVCRLRAYINFIQWGLVNLM